MPAYTRRVLSGSTNGKPIGIGATGTPGTLLHTALAGTTGFDEIWLWVANTSGGAATLTIEFGGGADPGDLLMKGYSVAANSGIVLVCPGGVLNNSLVCRAFSGTASVLNITGYVNRIE